MPVADPAIAALAAQALDHPIRTLILALPAALVVYVIANEVVRWRARVPGMKGPRGLPLVGNLLAIRENAAAQYKAWAEEYGDVYQVQMGNEPIVVVNSAKATRALWVGQSQALSSRPITYTFHKVRRSLDAASGLGLARRTYHAGKMLFSALCLFSTSNKSVVRLLVADLWRVL